jgi:hypothetical protein
MSVLKQVNTTFNLTLDTYNDISVVRLRMFYVTTRTVLFYVRFEVLVAVSIKIKIF